MRAFSRPCSATVRPKPTALSVRSEPAFEVIMMIVFSKLTVRPCASVIRPSSNICNRMFKTSGCAFSISSKRITQYGRRRIRSVSWPASSYPTYPGGAPMIRDTECFSINSDISNRISASGASNISCASCLTNSVLPTPVGPVKIKDTGFRFAARPTRLRRIAATTVSIAASWPLIRARRRSAIPESRAYSASATREAGMCVHSSITLARSASVNSGAGVLSISVRR